MHWSNRNILDEYFVSCVPYNVRKDNGDFSLVHAMKAYREMEIQLHQFLSSTLVEGA
jgi:hypothetical protein